MKHVDLALEYPPAVRHNSFADIMQRGLQICWLGSPIEPSAASMEQTYRDLQS